MSIKRDVLPLWEHIETEARPKVRFWVPDAAMDKDDLRRQLEQLKARGFGGVEIVTLNTTPKSVSEGPDGWGSANWNEMLRFIAATAGALGMSVDMANGPMWPISMPTVMSADDPASSKELTWGVLTCPEDGRYTGPLPKRRTVHEEGTPMLVTVMAYRTKDGQTLIQDSYTDLMCCLNDRQDGLDCRLPKAPAGERWLIFSFWCQPTMHKTGDGRFFVVDHLSEAGVQACEAYWAPILKNARDFEAMESIFCDSLEYRSVMEWTPKLPEYFQAWNGYAILPYLPVVGLNVMFPPTDAPEYHFENREISDQINRDYLETLTRCYCEFHLAGLERMANRYEKCIRYQVAYNKPFEEERSALYVGIPENEALGRPAMDNLKAMAAAAHLGRKRRYSFECAAEFGNAYGQMYEDLMWWVKRSAIAGMNAQVLHGATYDGGYHGEHSKNGFMEGVKWPGYEAFSKGVSNYWNRTLSETDARGVLDTISRINAVNLKKARVDCAVYRQGYTNDGVGSEFYFYPDDGALMNRGYSYETISTELLKLPVCRVTDGLLDADGPAYKALIIPECSYVSTEFTEKITELMDQGFPVVWIGTKPENARFYREVNTEAKKGRWQLALDKAWEHDAVIHVAVNSQVPEALSNVGILPDVLLEERMNIATAAHVDAGARIRYYELYGRQQSLVYAG